MRIGRLLTKAPVYLGTPRTAPGRRYGRAGAAMKRALGSSGIEVEPIGLGGMPMSIQGRPERARSLETLRAAFEIGVDFVDTADVYCLDDGDLGHNEELIAE